MVIFGQLAFFNFSSLFGGGGGGGGECLPMPTAVSKLHKSLKIKTERNFEEKPVPSLSPKTRPSPGTELSAVPCQVPAHCSVSPIRLFREVHQPYYLKWTFIGKNTRYFQCGLRIPADQLWSLQCTNKMMLVREWNRFPFHLPSTLMCSWSQNASHLLIVITIL